MKEAPGAPAAVAFQVSHIWTFSYKFLFFSRKPSAPEIEKGRLESFDVISLEIWYVY